MFHKKTREKHINEAFQVYGKVLDNKIDKMPIADTNFSLNYKEKSKKLQDKSKSFAFGGKKKILSITALAMSALLLIIIGINGLGVPNRIPNSNVVYAAELPNSETHRYGKVDESITTGLENFTVNSMLSLMQETDTNENYSSLATFIVLALLAEGSTGDTQKEILDVLGLNETHMEILGAEVKTLYQNMYIKDKVELNNSLWMSEAIEYKEEFINTAESFYSSLYTVDYDSRKTVKYMENWVAHNTHGSIKPNFEINPQEIFTIINTIYMKGKWYDQFSVFHTKNGDFNLLDDETARVSYMNKTDNDTFFYSENFIRATISSDAGNMVFILPREDKNIYDLMESEKSLHEALYGGIKNSGDITWQVPKFDIKGEYNVKENLQEMGVEKLFTPSAELNGMVSNGQIAYLAALEQKTYLTIDEFGFEAGLYIKGWGAGSEAPGLDKADMILDKPFLFGIEVDGQYIFTGVITNPTEG